MKSKEEVKGREKPLCPAALAIFSALEEPG